MGDYKESLDRPKLYSVVPSDGTRGNRHKLRHMKLPLNLEIFGVVLSVVKQWHRLSRVAVESPSLEITQNPTRHSYS